MLRLRVTAGRDPLPTAPITGRPGAHTDTTVSVVIASVKAGGTLTAEEWQVTQSNRLIRRGKPSENVRAAVRRHVVSESLILAQD